MQLPFFNWIDNLYMVCTRKKYRSGFSPVRQDTSGKFGCPVLSGLDTHMSSPVEAYVQEVRNTANMIYRDSTDTSKSLLKLRLFEFLAAYIWWHWWKLWMETVTALMSIYAIRISNSLSLKMFCLKHLKYDFTHSIYKSLSKLINWSLIYRISSYSFRPWIVSSLE